MAGDEVLRQTASAYAESIGRRVQVYKNNTDFHGASYGTHESYLVPRSLGFDRLFAGIMPMLVARQILTGAGKVGAELGHSATYQVSQRADFFMEPANAETLYRRPVFNTRDEPHAESAEFVRLHVISGDSNMISSSTVRKAGLVKLAIRLVEIGEAPNWPIKDPVRSFQSISRDESYEFRVELMRGSWTTAGEILESYFSAAERFDLLDDEERAMVADCRRLLVALKEDFERFAYDVDWAAKRILLEQYMSSEGTDWRDPALASFDLEYHNLDPEEGLHAAMVDSGMVRPNIAAATEPEPTRALVRATAVRRFADQLESANWRGISLKVNGGTIELPLRPDALYPESITHVADVEAFISAIRSVAAK
jgi:proteasome accessory factor A